MNPLLQMTEAQKQLIKIEDDLREKFANNPSSINDKYLLLHKVFDEYHTYKRVPEDEKEQNQPHILHNILKNEDKVKYGESVIVDRETFFKNWEDFTLGMFKGLDWSNIFCAGGSILGNLATNNYGKRGKDIDLFIYGVETDEEANKVLKRICDCVVNNIKEKGKGVQITRTLRAVTIINSYPFRPVQIILRQYKSPGEVLLGFDIDSCTVGYDGLTNEVYAMDRFRRAITKGYNLVNQSRRSTTYEQRLFKYSLRGFAVIVPGLKMNNIKPDLFRNETRVRSLRGLKKLLYYDHLARNKGYRINEPSLVKESDYSGDLEIPFGPNYDHERIMRVLSYKDKKRFFGIIMNNKKARARGETPSIKPSRLIEHLFFDSNGNPTQQLTWIKETPAYQDIDNNHRRLMVGSFQLPPLDEIWDKGVYIGDEDDDIPSKQTGTQQQTTGTQQQQPTHRSFGQETSSHQSGVSFQPSKFSPVRKNILPKKRNPKQQQPTSMGGSSFSDKSKSSTIGGRGVPSSFGSTSSHLSSYFSSTSYLTNPTSQPSGGTVHQQPTLAQPFSFGFQSSTSSTQPSTDPFYQPPSIPSSTVSSDPPMNKQSFTVGLKSSTQQSTDPFYQPPSIPSSTVSSDPPMNQQSSTIGSTDTPSTDSFYQPTELTNQFSYSPSMSSQFVEPKDKSQLTPISSKYGPQPGKIPPSYYYYGTPPQPQSFYNQENQQSVQPPDYFQLSSSSLFSENVTQQQPAPLESNQYTQPSSQSTHKTQQTVLKKDSYKQSNHTREEQNEVYTNKERTPTTKLLLLVDLCFRTGRITKEQKGKIKDLIIIDHPKLLNALDVFIIQHDVDDFVDTALRIVSNHMKSN